MEIQFEEHDAGIRSASGPDNHGRDVPAPTAVPGADKIARTIGNVRSERVMHRLHVVAVEIADESAVVARVVLRPHPRSM